MTIDTTTTAQLLEEERAYLAQRLESVDETMEALRASRATREDRADAGSGSNDGDPMSVEIETQTKIRATLVTRLEDVDAAVARLAAGTYGVCSACGNEIAAARLEALPAAERCVGCSGRR